MSGKLYVVGTPIGNLNDLSPRAAKTLAEVDFIAAEDTRVSLKILSYLQLKKPMISYYEHNMFERGEIITERIVNGENCAIVTDAGMPAISDPGEMLVKQCREAGIEVVSVPGPCALITALAVSGMPSGRFCFEGFLSVNKKSRKEHLEMLKNETRTMIFYEAPHKLLATLNDLYACFGNRKISISRELTKIHEETFVTNIKSALENYSEKAPKGEFVIIIEGAKEQKTEYTLEDAVIMADELIEKGEGTSLAAKKAAAATGQKKSEIYSAIINE